MSKRFDEEWLKEYQRRTGCKAVQTGGPEAKLGKGEEYPEFKAQFLGEFVGGGTESKRPSKYGNKKAVVEGEAFDSRHEARMYERLRLEGLAGNHIGLARQVTFFLPGGVKYMADFVTLHKDGTYRVLDAKSEGTRKNPVYRLKKRQMKNCLGVEIEEI